MCFVLYFSDCPNTDINLVLNIQGSSVFNQERDVRRTLQNNQTHIDDLIHLFSGLSLEDCTEGSVIIHLRTRQTNENALGMTQKQFVNGNLRKMISAILEKSGIVKDTVVHVTVDIGDDNHASQGMCCIKVYSIC